MIDFVTATPEETIKYFTQNKWGSIYDDDKYFRDEELEDNFIVFCTYAFAWQGLPRPTYNQYMIALHLYKKENQHRMVWASRGLGKSYFSQLYVTWRLLNDPNEHILVMSASSGRASNYTGFVKKLISLLPITHSMTPQHNKQRTSSTAFDVTGASPSDSPSLYAVGVGTAVTGFRGTLIIADDIESSVTAQSTTQTETTLHQFYEAMNLLMSGKDESIILATPHSISSLYIELLDRGWKLLALPAEVPDSDSAYFNGLSPHIKAMIDKGMIGVAVDERLNKDFLLSKKMRIGKSNFKLQYQLDVSDSDDLKYPLKLSDFVVMDVDDEGAPLKVNHSSMPDKQLYIKHHGFKADRFYSPSYVSDETAPYEMKLMSIDPSGRGKDEIGISIIYSLNTRLFVKKITGIQGGYEDDNMIQIAQLCKIHNIDTLLLEENWGGGMFTKMLEPHLVRISPKTEIDEVNVRGQKEIRIIEALEPLLNQHRLVIDKDTLDKDFNASAVNSFTYQLSKITKERESLRHDDRLDSLANGVIYMIDKMSDDEEFGLEKWSEKEGKNNLDFTLSMFDNRNVVNSNYGLVF